MNLLPLFLAGLCGALLAALHLIGLWFTVRKLPTASMPELLLLISSVARLVLVTGGFYFVTAGRWERALACLVGFLIARSIILWTVRPAAQPADISKA